MCVLWTVSNSIMPWNMSSRANEAHINIRGLKCQYRGSMAGTCNYTPLVMSYVITYPCSCYLLLAHTSSIESLWRIYASMNWVINGSGKALSHVFRWAITSIDHALSNFHDTLQWRHNEHDGVSNHQPISQRVHELMNDIFLNICHALVK